VDWAFNAGVCHEVLGDSSTAAAWYAEVRARARRLARHLRAPE